MPQVRWGYEDMQTIVTLWRTRTQPIRTISEISAHIKILPTRQIPLYQKISRKVKQLKSLGMPYHKIAKRLNTSEVTIDRIGYYITTIGNDTIPVIF